MDERNQVNPVEQYYKERDERIASYKNNQQLTSIADAFVKELAYARYSANFSWLGRPVIQIPQDLMAMQEIIWSIKPDVIIETGIAHGGSLIFYASMLELTGKGTVIGIDIDIRAHNRIEIEKHPLFKRITMIEGSSISQEVFHQVKSLIKSNATVMVCLDSNHTHSHVLGELQLYAPLVSPGSYCVVFDTGIEDLPPHMIVDRPWGPGNNPKTAVWEYLKADDRFIIDKDIEAKILITAAPDGFLRRIR
jgi:cephalosporin hydroxylase